MTDPIREALDRLAAIPADVIPGKRRRPNKAAVARVLARNGQTVVQHQTTVTEDVDGIPSTVERTEHHATLAVSLEHLGWTQAEYDNPSITE